LAQFINYYSFLLVTIGIMAVAALVLLTHKPKPNDFISFGVISLIAIMAWVILHPRQTPLMDDAKVVQQMIGAGTPVLLEFQSPIASAAHRSSRWWINWRRSFQARSVLDRRFTLSA
jgi:hypothetical protein